MSGDPTALFVEAGTRVYTPIRYFDSAYLQTLIWENYLRGTGEGACWGRACCSAGRQSPGLQR